MPRVSCQVPRYRKHKPTGQGVVTLEGRDIYLGVYGTAKSQAEYQRVIAEWLANGRRLPVDSTGLLVGELIHEFQEEKRHEYLGPDGRPNTEFKHIKRALKTLGDLYELLVRDRTNLWKEGYKPFGEDTSVRYYYD